MGAQGENPFPPCQPQAEGEPPPEDRVQVAVDALVGAREGARRVVDVELQPAFGSRQHGLSGTGQK
eukprot:227879-Pyramimonas_sp.AAC.1